MDIEKLPLLGIKEASFHLNIKPGTLHIYTKKYQIPHKILSCGKIYLRSDIETFQEGRKGRLKHRRK